MRSVPEAGSSALRFADDGLPLDGMPVVFGGEIDIDTLDAADFEITRS
jgi:hypothetical protein